MIATTVKLIVGLGSVREWIVSTFQSSVDVLLPLAFGAFFVGTAIALAFNRRRYVRRTYVAGFFAVLVTINLIGLPVLPMMYWHKFSEPRPESQTHYEFRLVDTDGDELRYQTEATLAVDGVTLASLQRKMLTDYSREKNERIARYLIQRAREHRQRVTTRSPFRYLRFPPHGLIEGWDRETLARHSAFVGLRLYRVNLTTSADGTKVLSRSEEVVLEFFPNERSNASTNVDNNGNMEVRVRSGTTSLAQCRSGVPN